MTMTITDIAFKTMTPYQKMEYFQSKKIPVIILEQINYITPFEENQPTKKYFLQHVGEPICQGKQEGGGFDSLSEVYDFLARQVKLKSVGKKTYIYVNGYLSETYEG